jgi:hypothetical protein
MREADIACKGAMSLVKNPALCHVSDKKVGSDLVLPQAR